MEQKFDAIVVGAGPAGSACALKMARAGLQVLLVERGKFPGAKNMWGGAFYGPRLGELFPGFWNEAPVERHVARRRISMLGGGDCLSIEFTSAHYDKPPYHGFTLLRSKFDRWMASKAEEAGAILASGLRADDLLFSGERVSGIRAGGDDLPADVVVACDGVNSLLAQKAGLRRELAPGDLKLGVKEILELPRADIERRFGLQGDEGIAWEFIGCTEGIPGGGFIYTNRESLSVGIVVQLSALSSRGVKSEDLLEKLKKHPAVAKLIEGARLAEYSAHLIPVSGAEMTPGLCRDGMLVAGDAAALVLATGIILEGANFALASGLAAAETVIEAKKKGDFTSAALGQYRRTLEESFVLKDLETFWKAPHFLENPRIYAAYPELFCDFAAKLFTSDGSPRKHAWDLMKEAMKDRVSFWTMARDMMKGKGAL